MNGSSDQLRLMSSISLAGRALSIVPLLHLLQYEQYSNGQQQNKGDGAVFCSSATSSITSRVELPTFEKNHSLRKEFDMHALVEI